MFKFCKKCCAMRQFKAIGFMDPICCDVCGGQN